jgi:hypothetical protein
MIKGQKVAVRVSQISPPVSLIETSGLPQNIPNDSHYNPTEPNI